MNKPIVVIGGGHNGLVAACTLAKRGHQVVLCESRARLGGLAGPVEFGKGFTAPGVHHDTRGLAEDVVEQLELERHGLTYRDPADIVCLAGDQPAFTLRSDSLDGPINKTDRQAYDTWRAFVRRTRPVVKRLLSSHPLDPLGRLWPLIKTGWAVRKLGPETMLELMRVAPMCVADWMRDTFANEGVMAAVALGGLEQAWVGPWSAHSAANLLQREAMANREVVGGAAGVVRALEKSAATLGVDVRLSTRVSKICVTDGWAAGVELEGGETLDAAAVVSSLDPKRTFIDLVGRRLVSSRLIHDVENFRMRGTAAVVRLGLDGPLELSTGEQPEALRVLPGSLDALENEFDAVKYGRASEAPWLDVRVPTVSQSDLAPEGKHVVSILAHYAPYDLEGGWTDEARADFGDRVVRVLAEHCVDLESLVNVREVVSPADLEEQYGVSGGHLYHGEHAPDQLLFMRPTVDCGDYATPLKGLWLCGGSSHPGGGVSGLCGLLGAAAMHKSISKAR